jgi:precorrin-6Y C5,15-methyltransferase (decarboxylating)
VPDVPGSVSMVGMHGGESFGANASQALMSATVVIADPRHLASLPARVGGRRQPMPASPADALDAVESSMRQGETVCVVVSGDPGFFGLARLASARFGRALRIHPAPSAVSLAFARAGTSWDDAVVVSAHGRDLSGAVEAVVRHSKTAVLTSPENPPERLGRSLLDQGCGSRVITVFSRLGEPDESVWEGHVEALAAGRFDGLSVVVCATPTSGSAGGPGLGWGLPEAAFEHRDGMITKAEVRAVALGKLALPPTGTLWDVGAGSGSVSTECCRLAPGLRVFAVERDAAGAETCRANLAATSAVVVEGEAPAALESLPDPDRVFLGGGGVAVLDEAIKRMRPGGTVVATYATLERAAYAADRLGNVVQVAVSRGVRAGTGGPFRLDAENPVFVCWGSP